MMCQRKISCRLTSAERGMYCIGPNNMCMGCKLWYLTRMTTSLQTKLSPVLRDMDLKKTTTVTFYNLSGLMSPNS